MMPVTSRRDPGVHPISFFNGNVFAAFSGRQYPRARFDEFLRSAGFLPDALIRPKQVHGDEIIIVRHSRTILGGNPQACGSPIKPFGDDRLNEADGILTALPGPVLGILTADCIPAFFWDPIKKVAGLAHAGWRGLKAGILEKMIFRMKESFCSAPENIQIVFGLFIGACCYEVGKEFSEYFPLFYRPLTPEKGRVDLAASARQRMMREGIPPLNLHDSEICTSCSHEAFFSARRGDADERVLSVIQIR